MTVRLIQAGGFPDAMLYYIEHTCETCGARNYVVLHVGATLGRCWNCGTTHDLPSYIEISKPEHEPVLN